ncbi:MAG TPA: hypothetical protein VMZ06_07985 [Candidatus Bathyarchaeia archaeon]|nr:hypothetical protein [Candidatus Bathyarchaeia archaeon]
MADNNALLDTLIAKVTGGNDDERTEAWFNAGKVGASAVKPLAGVISAHSGEAALAAKRALWQIARYAARPGADAERQSVVAALAALLNDETESVPARSEALWILSEIGDDAAVEPVASVLRDEALREDARMALERIPGDRSLAALKAAFDAAPDAFKPNIAQSLRQRGVDVPGVPCVRFVPTKKTAVQPKTEK